ncbi:class I histocompatibility antigen, Gogo-OKO alpha chain-like [Brachyhypopomus gauderio]|uniref:class I histocompatibility antigen, Gogo-OKO alpha chain-like n=1 Tax=Brachyhypopomus gauderio TaxID=698409 RepID=UPI0040420E05
MDKGLLLSLSLSDPFLYLVPPKVTLIQENSSSVVCDATGFFPKAITISWKKNEEDVNENTELRETLPNHDATFQKRSILTVSPEDLKNHKYTCVVQHSGLERDAVTPFYPGGVLVRVIVGVVVSVLLLVLIGCVGFFIWRKKKNASAGESSITSSSQTQQKSNISDGGSLSPTPDDSIICMSKLMSDGKGVVFVWGVFMEGSVSSIRLLLKCSSIYQTDQTIYLRSHRNNFFVSVSFMNLRHYYSKFHQT